MEESPGVRRNGKLFSCEPCRKSKLSCDHTLPTCGRCRRRRIEDKCIYHPAPMTGVKPKPVIDPRTRSLQIRSTSRSASPKRQRLAIPGSESSRLNSSTQIRSTTGFLGSTSYSAVFDDDENTASHSAEATSEVALPTSTLEGREMVKQGAAVLAHLSQFPNLEKLASEWGRASCDLALISPFLPAVLKAMVEDVYEPFVKSGNQKALMKASEVLFENTSKPLKIPPNCSFRDFELSFTGKNIRWETVGVFFTAAGQGGTISQSREYLGAASSQCEVQRQLAHRMLDASNACVGFIDALGQLNDVSMWGLHQNAVLMSQVLGDANYLTWRRLGDLSTAIFAMGLHQEIKISSDIPFWLAEMRRRCLNIAYGVDKMLSTFVGRPPRISKRYCSVQPPLDLEMYELCGPNFDPEVAMKTIGRNGWNTDGKMRRAAFGRTFVIVAIIREDILELSLGPARNDTFEVGAEIARRNKEAWDSYPEAIKYHHDVWSTDRSGDECSFAVVIYLDIVYNDFLLQRTLVRRIRAKSDELVRISRLLMSTIIDVINYRNRMNKLTCDIPWIIAIYGLPSAGVLALELLQQIHSRTSNNGNKNFPRSEVIQNLSVFVSCLSWIHSEGDGNYNLVQQAKRMIQTILDKVLSPEPYLPSIQSSQQSLMTPENSEFATSDEVAGVYDFSWMDSTEFGADFWSNLPDHPLFAFTDGAA